MLYGITIGSKGPQLNPQAIIDMKDLGMTGLRFQIPLAMLKQSFALYDDAVAKCNAAKIDLTLIIKHFPDTPGFPTPQEASDMAYALASRYDGQHGHGTVQVIEIGNEDFQYTDFHALGDAMNATYTRVKGINPHVLITPGSTLQRNTTNMKAAVTALLNVAGKSMDAVNIHTYFGIPGNGPHTPEDGSTANIPSFPQYVQAVKDVCVATGFPNMPIWDTEFGFPSTPVNHGTVPVFSETDQWTHLKYCYDQGKTLGLARMYQFTLGYATPAPDGMSLVQAGGKKTIAYTGLKAWIAASGGLPTPPVPPPPDPIKQQILALLEQARAHADAQGDALIDQAIPLIQTL